jgi:hypothetical protein
MKMLEKTQIKIKKLKINLQRFLFLYSHFVAGKAMGERMSQNKSGK